MPRYRYLRKMMRIPILSVCLLFFFVGLTWADTADPNKAKRKAALNAFFDAQLCGDCHGSSPVYNLQSAKAGWEVSGHAKNGNAFYANGGGCQKCHTQEGFLEYLATGKNPDSKSYVKMPSQPGCYACHNPHKSPNPYMLIKKPVKICIQCHSEGYITDIPVHRELKDCLSCHNPHLGKNMFLLKKDYDEVF